MIVNLSINTPKGAEVVAFASIEDVSFILCRRSSNVQPYVTWQLDEKGNPFAGNYFQYELAARLDFLHRIQDII